MRLGAGDAVIGPVGATLYVLSCKEPAPGRHEQFDGSGGTMTMAMPKTEAPSVTRAQITAVGVLTLTALAAGVLLGAAFCSFSM